MPTQVIVFCTVAIVVYQAFGFWYLDHKLQKILRVLETKEEPKPSIFITKMKTTKRSDKDKK